MVFTGIGRLAGYREGSKNNKNWMNAFIDDAQNPLDRLQLFVADEVQGQVRNIPIGSDVQIEARIYMRSSSNGYSQIAGSLASITVVK